ncbi:hypothetical protein KIAC18_002311 [Sporomusa sphaeroides]|uniref:hypothetical protein n=1 Tax=Sporomusa sphaeroides TaxID=47679 RepID=UPI003DA16F37
MKNDPAYRFFRTYVLYPHGYIARIFSLMVFVAVQIIPAKVIIIFFLLNLRVRLTAKKTKLVVHYESKNATFNREFSSGVLLRTKAMVVSVTEPLHQEHR